MPTRSDIRLREYTPGGARGRVVDTLELEMTQTFTSMSSCRASVSDVVYGTVPSVMEVAVERWTGSSWVEPRNARFLVKDQALDERDPAGVHNLVGASLWDWLLRKNVLAAGDAELLVDGKRSFTSATPGAIMLTFIEEAQTRGWAPYLNVDFTASLDSAGEPWASVLTIAYEPGRITGLIALDNLVDQGVVERSSQGRTLSLFNPDTGVDRSDDAGPGYVVLAHAARGVPVRRNIDDLVTDLTFYGENGLVLEMPNVGAYNGLGRLETAIVQGGVSDEGTATLLGTTALQQGKEVRESVSVTEDAAVAEYLPSADYDLGDWVMGRRKVELERLRVQAIMWRKNPAGVVTVSPTLNDRFLDLLERLARRTIGITGGAVAGGSGAVPAPEGGDTRQPKAPAGLVVDSAGYYDLDGTSRAQVSLDWEDVTEGTNDVAIDVDHYETWARPDDGSSLAAQYVTRSDDSFATATLDPTGATYVPGDVWLFKVRAVSENDIPGPFSDEVSVTMLDADPALDAPAPPIVTTRNGVVVVTTTGLFDTDPPSTAPAWFREFRIDRAADEAGPYVPIAAITRGQDSRVLADMAVGDTWWFTLTALDRLGRESAPSDAVSVTVAGIDGGDVMVNTLHGNRVIAGTIEASAVVSGFGAQIELGENVTIIAQQSAIDGVAAEVDTVAGDVAAVDSNLAEMQTYYTFGPSGAVITSPGSDFSQRIASDRTEMRQGAQVISYWEAGKMVVPRLETDTVRLGNHQWEKSGSAGSVIRALS